MSKVVQPLSNTRPSAVMLAFDDDSSALCPVVRADVDQVLARASDFAIRESTPNEHLLSAYMWPDVIGRLYIALNIQLGKYPGFKPFVSDSISNKSTISDVRKMAYQKCDVRCSHV